MRALLFACLLAASAAAQPALGETSFENSGSADAQESFLRGLLLLHSFEYDDARDAFQQARRVDPDFAMAAWGEAMTHNHPIWMQQNPDAARLALQGVDVSDVTPREAAYLGTLDVLFGDGDKEDRDDRYAQAMQRLAEQFPDDLDARSFYALALLGTAHEGRDFTTYMKAAAVAEEVFDVNPRHPGAAHYLIHAYDDPVHAPLGLRPARVYAEIAPSASHALHMPSHIYLALGMWDRVVEMNERSYLAAKDGSDRRGDALNGHGWHALWWWHYGATQQNDRALADRLLALAEAEYPGDEAPSALAHVVRIRSQHALAFQAWDVVVDAAPPSDMGATTIAIDALARGTAQIQRNERGAARATLTALDNAIAHDHDEASWTARAARLQLEAQLLAAEGDTSGSLDRLRDAAALEAAAPMMFGPPSPVVPAHEALGLALLDTGDTEAARQAFETSLGRQTNRRQTVEALGRAQ